MSGLKLSHSGLEGWHLSFYKIIAYRTEGAQVSVWTAQFIESTYLTTYLVQEYVENKQK